jgi:CMP-N-acetylneuraminic acid synthetase
VDGFRSEVGEDTRSRHRVDRQQYGAEMPFTRPADFAGDRSTHVDVVLHALRWLMVANALLAQMSRVETQG